MGNWSEALKSAWAQLYVGPSIVATIALAPETQAPPIIVWQQQVFRQTSRSTETWRYDVVEALFV